MNRNDADMASGAVAFQGSNWWQHVAVAPQVASRRVPIWHPQIAGWGQVQGYSEIATLADDELGALFVKACERGSKWPLSASNDASLRSSQVLLLFIPNHFTMNLKWSTEIYCQMVCKIYCLICRPLIYLQWLWISYIILQHMWNESYPKWSYNKSAMNLK